MLIIKCDFCEETDKTSVMHICQEIGSDGTGDAWAYKYHICLNCLRRLAKGGGANETAQTD